MEWATRFLKSALFPLLVIVIVIYIVSQFIGGR